MFPVRTIRINFRISREYHLVHTTLFATRSKKSTRTIFGQICQVKTNCQVNMVPAHTRGTNNSIIPIGMVPVHTRARTIGINQVRLKPSRN